MERNKQDNTTQVSSELWEDQYPNRLHRFSNRALGATVIASSGIMGASIATQLVPYEDHIAGVEIEARANTSGFISLNSNLGDVYSGRIFSALPIGLEITPTITGFTTITGAMDNSTQYTEQFQEEMEHTIPRAVGHFGLVGAIGLLGGSGVATELYTRRREQLSAPSMLSTGVATAILLTGGLAGVSYNAEWQKTWNTTGALAELLQTPDQLEQLSQMDITAGYKQLAALDALREIIANSPEQGESEKPALKIALISDMHLRNMYPQLKRFIEQHGVDFIINAGDETEFGSVVDLTIAPSYLDSIEEITVGLGVPMVWVKGNHDSLVVAKQMSAIDGVYVLDKETIDMFGLRIAGIGDPRTFSEGGDVSSEVVAQQEREYISEVIPLMDREDLTMIDIFVTHHPDAAEQAAVELGAENVRMTMSGHFHRNSVKQGEILTVTIGSTGMGGIANLGNSSSVMEFGLMTVASDCEFQQLTLYASPDPTLESRGSGVASVTQITLDSAAHSRETVGRICGP